MIRKAVREDFKFFFAVKSEEDNIYWCGYRDKPTRENLQMFWDRNVPGNGTRDIYMILEKDHPVGYLYVDHISDKEAELSIGISIAESGKGYGKKAIEEAIALLSAKKVSAIGYIREDNDKSQRLISKAGMYRTEEYREMILPCGKQNRRIKLYKWKYDP